MSTQKGGAPFHGLLLVDKDSGPTSHDVVSQLRRILKTKEVGHAGTLDPLASGLLVLLIGEGTKLSSYVTDQDKGYDVILRLGSSSDTLDRLGSVTTYSDVRPPSHTQVLEVTSALTGDIELRVPDYAAVKVEGRKLYDYARANEVVPEVRRTMSFYDIELLSYEFPLVRFRLKCSKGAFVRAWGAELGSRLGCEALVEELRREFSSPYSLADAIRVEALEKIFQPGPQPETRFDTPLDIQSDNRLKRALVPLSEGLPDWPQVAVAGRAEALLANGQIAHQIAPQLLKIALHHPAAPGVRLISADSGRLLALAGRVRAEAGAAAVVTSGFRILRVFPNRPNQ